MILECKAFKFMGKAFGPYLYLGLSRAATCITLVGHPGSNMKVDSNNVRKHSGRTSSQLLHVGGGQAPNCGGRNQRGERGCWWQTEW